MSKKKLQFSSSVEMSIVSFFIYCSDRCFICCYTKATIICFIEFRKMIQWLARKSQIMMMMKSFAWRQVISIANIATILLLQRQIPYPHWTNPKVLLKQRLPHAFYCLSKKDVEQCSCHEFDKQIFGHQRPDQSFSSIIP